MEPFHFENANSRGSFVEDPMFSNISTKEENENLRLQIKQLHQRLSQCTLDWNTEKVAKRAIQRELDSLRVLLKSIQSEECLNWSRQNQSLNKPFQASSTNPFECDRDEADSLGMYDEILPLFFQRTQSQLDSLEFILTKISVSFTRTVSEDIFNLLVSCTFLTFGLAADF